MKKKTIISLVLPVCLLFMLVGWSEKGVRAENLSLFYERECPLGRPLTQKVPHHWQCGSSQMAYVGSKQQEDCLFPITPLTELHTPAAILYIKNGETAAAFTPEDEAFEEILRLNAARDLLEPGRIYQYYEDCPGGTTAFYFRDYQKDGAYLLYRYPKGSYGDIIFCLADPAAPEQCVNWFFEASENCPVTVRLAPADELLAFLDSAV